MQLRETRKWCVKPAPVKGSRDLCFAVTERNLLNWMTTDGHRVLYSTMKIYEANPLIAVVLISLVFESTGQNTGMLKATQSQGVKSVKWLKRLRVVTALKAVTTTTPFITICHYILLYMCFKDENLWQECELEKRTFRS